MFVSAVMPPVRVVPPDVEPERYAIYICDYLGWWIGTGSDIGMLVSYRPLANADLILAAAQSAWVTRAARGL